jgi:hypothetical protein
MGKINLKYSFILGLVIFLVSWFQYRNNYKFVDNLLPNVKGYPSQTKISNTDYIKPCCKGSYCWEFTPLYNYDITAYVFGTSHKFTSKLKDVAAADIGFLWGENAVKKTYKDVKLRVVMDHFYARWKSGGYFNMQDASNTHVLSCDDGVFKKIRSIKISDQVRLKGYLVNINISKKLGETDPRKIMKWNSSVRRTDKREGACEVMYIKSEEDIEILIEGPRLYLWLKWLGMFLISFSIIMGLLRFNKKNEQELENIKKIDF